MTQPAPHGCGPVVLITGAAAGLGAALCQRYAAAGARIAAMDRDENQLAKTVAQLPAGTLAIGGLWSGDISQAQACAAAVAQTVAHFGALDVLINNAGISSRSVVQASHPDVIRKVMEVNFFGAMQMTHAALPHLLARRGVVVAISSVAGHAPLYGRAAYSASKHALHGFFDTLRTEVEDQGMQVTLVCPSFMATGIGSNALGGTGAAAHTARITTGGESDPADIAQRIFAAVTRRQPLLLPDRTARLAWWVHKLLPAFYARTMKRRVRAEFQNP